MATGLSLAFSIIFGNLLRDSARLVRCSEPLVVESRWLTLKKQPLKNRLRGTKQARKLGTFSDCNLFMRSN
jgi:hypothetical protein